MNNTIYVADNTNGMSQYIRVATPRYLETTLSSLWPHLAASLANLHRRFSTTLSLRVRLERSFSSSSIALHSRDNGMWRPRNFGPRTE
jgi:hypothetical protein